MLTSRLSANGVTSRLALPVRNSWLSLSPISVATEIMAVVMLMPRVMASTANALRRTWRRKDSNKRRANIRLLGEHSNLPGKIGARDNYGAGFSLAVFLLNRLQRNRIAASRLADTLRIDRRRAILTGDSVGRLVKAHGAANLAGVEDSFYFVRRSAKQQKPYLRSIDIHAVAVQVAGLQVRNWNFCLSIAVKRKRIRLGNGLSTLGVYKLRRDGHDKHESGEAEGHGP